MTRNKAIPVGIQPIHTSRKTNEMIHMIHNFQQKESFYQKVNTIHKANQHPNEQKIRCYNKTKIKNSFYTLYKCL